MEIYKRSNNSRELLEIRFQVQLSSGLYSLAFKTSDKLLKLYVVTTVEQMTNLPDIIFDILSQFQLTEYRSSIIGN